MAKEKEKRVVVHFGEGSRSVTFISGASDSESDTDLVLKPFRKTSSDQVAKNTVIERNSKQLKEFPNMGKTIQYFVKAGNVGADQWRRTGLLICLMGTPNSN